MKLTITLSIAVLAVLSGLALVAQPPQHHNSPYVDLQGREIKALAPEEMQSLLDGDGMGFALAAELNHYPGPKHVLELQEKIGLTADQRERVQQSYDRMHEEAQRLGLEIVAAERSLDGKFRSGELDAAGLEQAVTAIGTLRGQLRGVHLKAHLEMRELMTHQQIMAYVEARGYSHHRE